MSVAPSVAISEGYSFPVLRNLIRRTLQAGDSVLLRGHPGVGKSALACLLADQDFKLPLFDIRLAQKDPAELNGVYVPNRDKRCLELFPPDWVRAVCEQPSFVFLDEFNCATTKLHMSAAYQIVLEKRVGEFVFHPQTVVMAAGNLEEDGSIVTPLTSALKNRFSHYVLRHDADAWLEWAASNNLCPDVMAFIGTFREEKLYVQTDEYAYPTPRSWAKAANINHMDAPEGERRGIMTAAIGAAMTGEFFNFLKIYRKVDLPGILQRGEIPGLNRNKGLDFIFALTFAVGHLIRSKGIKDTQIPNLFKLFSHPNFDDEFAALLLKHIEKSKAFRMIAESPIFRPVKDRITRLLLASE